MKRKLQSVVQRKWKVVWKSKQHKKLFYSQNHGLNFNPEHQQQQAITDVLDRIQPLGDKARGIEEREYDVQKYLKKDSSHKRNQPTARVKNHKVEVETGSSTLTDYVENIAAMPEGTVSKDLMMKIKRGDILPETLKENIVFEHTKDGFVDIYDKTDPHFWSTTLRLMKDPGDMVDDELEEMKQQDTSTTDAWFNTYNLPRNLINYTRLFSILALQGKRYQAIQAFEDMQTDYHIRPDAVAYVTVMQACAQDGDYEQCKVYMEEMIGREIAPAVENYGTLARSFCKAGKLDEAVQLVEMMREHDIETNEVIHSILLQGMIEAGELTRAWKHYQFMQTRYAVMPDIICYTMMMNCAAIAGDVEKALSMFDQLEPRGLIPTRQTYNVLIKACSKRKTHLEEAFQFADEMEAMGFTPTHHTLNALIYAAAQQKDPRKAFNVLKKMRAQYQVQPNPETYSVLMLAYANNQAVSTSDHSRNIEEVEAIIEQIENRPEVKKIPTYINLLILVYARAYRVHEAIHVFNTKFKEWDLKPDNYSYQALMIMFAQLNRYERSVELLNDMVSRGIKPLYKSYFSIIRGMIRAGEHDLAFGMMRRMHKESGYMLAPHDIRTIQLDLAKTTNKFKELQVQRSDRGLLELDIEDDELD